MKKSLLLTLIAVSLILIGTAATSLSDSSQERITLAPNTAVWIGEEDLYIAQPSGTVLYQADSHSRFEIIYSSDQAILHMDVDQGRVALITENSLVMVDNRGREMAAYPLSQLRERGSFPLHIHSIRLDGDTLYLLGGDLDSSAALDKGAISSLDMLSGDIHPLSIPSFSNEHIIALDIYGASLFALSKQSGYLSVIDLKSNRLLDLADLGLMTAGSCADLRVRDGMAYILTNEYILQSYDIQSGVSRQLSDTAFDQQAHSFFIRGDHAYLIEPDRRGAFAVHLAGPENMITLMAESNDVYATPALTAALEAAREDHSPLGMNFHYFPDNRVLVTQLMAGESDVDILFHQQASSLHPTWLYRAGAIEEISEDHQIRLLLSSYLGAEAVSTFEGKLLGFPILLMPDVWCIDRALFEKTGIPIPETPWNWDDFFGLGQELAQYNALKGTTYKLIADTLREPYGFMQYMLSHQSILKGSLDLETEEFRSLALGWKHLIDRDLVYPLRYNYDEPMVDDTALIRIKHVSPYDHQFYYDTIQPPQGCPDCRFPVNAITAMLNSRAEPKEAAEDFYKAYAQQELEQGTAKLPANDAADNSQKARALRTVLENPIGMAIQWDVYHAIFTDHLPAYLSGDISLDQFIFSAQQQVDMILGE